MTEASKYISLRAIVFILVLVITLFFSTVFFVIFQTAMPEMLLESENNYLKQQLAVVEGLFYDAIKNTYVLAEDTAFWDESVAFATGENPDYFSNNWPESSLPETFHLNVVAYADQHGKIRHIEFIDYLTNQPLPVPAGFSDYASALARRVIKKYQETDLSSDRKMTDKKVVAGYLEDIPGLSGIALFGDQAYILSCAPIAGDRSEQTPSGALIFGNILSNEYFRMLTRYSSSDFAVSARLEDNAGPHSIRFLSDTEMIAEIALRDIDGSPALLRISDLRQIYSQGKTALDRTTVLLFLLLLAFVFALYQSVRKLVLKPLENLSYDLKQVKASENPSLGTYSKTREFAALRAAVTGMLEHINRSQISMDVLRNILDGIEAYIYVTDTVTDELLFVNKPLIRHMGINGDYRSKTCWQVLRQGQTGRCAFCVKPQLDKNTKLPVVWESYNAPSKCHYRHTDCLITWPGLDSAHLQHSVDITYIKNAGAVLERRLAQQELMSAMAQSFISTADTATLINNALRMAGEFMTSSRILVTRFNDANQTLELAYDWRHPRFGQFRPNPDIWPFKEGTPEYDAFIGQKNAYMAVDDVDDVEALDLEQNHKVRSFIHIPIFVENSFRGLLSFTELDQAREWSESDVQLAKLIGSIISAAIGQKDMEENLLRMSAIVDSSPQFIAYVNKDGNFDYFNQGALDMSGYSAQELKSSGLAQIFDEKTYRVVRGEIIPRILRGVETDFELAMTKKDGTKRLMAFSAFKTSSSDVGIGTIATDITDQRNMERELIAAKEQAELSSHAKGDFLARMSHEMRTPMNAIIGMTSIAKASNDIEKKEYCLEKIDQASNHLLGVINDILDMSKIEANKFELSFTEFSFEKMLSRVINVINFRVEEKKQNFIIDVDKDMPSFIISDEQRLAQVIANLLSNAVKFTPEKGDITLAVRVINKEDNMYNVQVSVTDTGIGISREQQKKLFRSFEQADGGIARKFGGTGLGLAISKSIIELMHGKIWAESAQGQGASFVFNITVQKGGAEYKNMLSARINWSNLQLLLVDGNAAVLQYFKNFGASIGIPCTVAQNAAELDKTLAAYREKPFDLAFVDWAVPDADASELTKKIRAANDSCLVVALVSGTDWSKVENEARESGVSRFIPKPLFASDIVDVINESFVPQWLAAAASGGPEDAPAVPGPLNAGAVPAAGGKDCFKDFIILLAEDVPINSEIVTTLLEDTGVTIDCAQNGLEALTMFRDNPGRYDLILMDIHMPEIDGYEATRRIRSLGTEETETIPILAMTANVFREDIDRCLAAGMNDHLGKPIDMHDLMIKLAKYLVMSPKKNR
ncbi:MAG: response regulator [Deltaproteobacteria bacterium]|jgi:PAS domain S-box-containing protein|nr:response regulator [Deltaproteobacteria bacterium]